MEDFHALRLNTVAAVAKKKYIEKNILILDMSHTFCQFF